jgi:two-component system, LytTR family, response regulator
MDNVRVLIADSDDEARARLRSLLERCADIHIVAECADGLRAAAAIGRLRPDVAFLNLQLSGLDGFAVCGQIGEWQPHLVFTSETTQGAVRAFELRALDFVVKPFPDHRLMVSVERVRQAMAAANGDLHPEELRAQLREIRDGRPEQLAVRSRRAIVLLPMTAITWVEAQNAAVRVHLGRKSHVVRSTLAEIENRLPHDRFMRVHREAIVNLSRVQELLRWLRGDFRIVLSDGTMVPLGRRYRKDLEARLSIGPLRAEA